MVLFIKKELSSFPTITQKILSAVFMKHKKSWFPSFKYCENVYFDSITIKKASFLDLILLFIFFLDQTQFPDGRSHPWDGRPVFSRISVKCHQQAAVTLPGLHQLISTSVKPMPFIQHINSLSDFRKLSTSDYSLCDFKDIHHFVRQMTKWL